MKLDPFQLEEYLTQYEFSAPYLLCSSDAESFSMKEIIGMASDSDAALWDHLRLGYTEPYGHPALRQEIAHAFYEPLSAENILCFAGAEEGIFTALSTLCKSGDHVIVLTPCYQSLLEIPRAYDCEITAIALQEENEWRIDLAAIKSAIKPTTKWLVMNFPHNPTGQVITLSELQALIDLLDQHGIWLFSDEVYRLLGDPHQTWAPAAATLYPKALSLGVMSKSMGMAGLRIGWLACQNTQVLHELKKTKDYLSICNSAPAEIISLIALKNKDNILARNNTIRAHNMAQLEVFFKQHAPLFSWVKPMGGCTGFVRYHGPGSVDQLCTQLVQEHGVLLLPGSVYEVTTPHFRIGFGRSTMPQALIEFEKFLTQNPLN